MYKKLKLALSKWWKRHICDMFPKDIDQKLF